MQSITTEWSSHMSNQQSCDNIIETICSYLDLQSLQKSVLTLNKKWHQIVLDHYNMRRQFQPPFMFSILDESYATCKCSIHKDRVKDEQLFGDLCTYTDESYSQLPSSKYKYAKNTIAFTIAPTGNGQGLLIKELLLYVDKQYFERIQHVKLIIGGHELTCYPKGTLCWVRKRNREQMFGDSEKIVLDVFQSVTQNKKPFLFSSYGSLECTILLDQEYDTCPDWLTCKVVTCEQDDAIQKLYQRTYHSSLLEMDTSGFYDIFRQCKANQRLIACRNFAPCCVVVRWQRSKEFPAMPTRFSLVFEHDLRPAFIFNTNVAYGVDPIQYHIFDAKQCMMTSAYSCDTLFPEFSGIPPWAAAVERVRPLDSIESATDNNDSNVTWYALRLGSCNQQQRVTYMHPGNNVADYFIDQSGGMFSILMETDLPLAEEQAQITVFYRNVIRSYGQYHGKMFSN